MKKVGLLLLLFFLFEKLYIIYIVSLCYSSLYCFSSFAPNFLGGEYFGGEEGG